MLSAGKLEKFKSMTGLEVTNAEPLTGFSEEPEDLEKAR